jgi:hypothetical protein
VSRVTETAVRNERYDSLAAYLAALGAALAVEYQAIVRPASYCDARR